MLRLSARTAGQWRRGPPTREGGCRNRRMASLVVNRVNVARRQCLWVRSGGAQSVDFSGRAVARCLDKAQKGLKLLAVESGEI